MKKLLGILVLGLLWCNLSFASIDDLDIPIMKAEAETEIIKPNKEYRQSCETDVIIEGFGLNLKFNSYVDVNGKKQTLIEEVIFDLGEEGKFIMKSQQKIKADGTLSKVKASSDYVPDSVEIPKKDINQAKKMFKNFAKMFDMRAINYGEKVTPGIKSEDGKKEFVKLLKQMEGMFPDEDPKEVKEFIKMAKKDVEFELTKEYLGTTELNGEKFYAVRWKGILKYVGDIPELKEVFETLSADMTYFVHAPSGYRSAVKILTSPDETAIDMHDDMVCTIYKNDQMLTEVSLWSWRPKKVEPKEKTEVPQKEFMCVMIDENAAGNHPFWFYLTYSGTIQIAENKEGKQCGLIIELKKNKNLFDKFKVHWEKIQKNNMAKVHHADILRFTKGTSLETEYLNKRKELKLKHLKSLYESNYLTDVEDLKYLYENDYLTEEEFNKAKKKLLN